MNNLWASMCVSDGKVEFHPVKLNIDSLVQMGAD